MYPYFLITVISIFLALLYHLSNKKSRAANLLLFLSFTSLFIFSAIRYNVYTDYLYTYVPEYHKIAAGATNTHFEFLFYIFNLVIYHVFNNVDWLFIITSFIIIFFTGKALKEKSPIIPLSIFIMIGSRMYFYSFDQIRQYITIAIFLYNIKNIVNKNWKEYFLLTIISGFIHKLSFIYLPLYFLNKLKFKKKTYILILISIIALCPIYTNIIDSVAKYFYADYYNYGSFINGTRINNSTVLTILAVLNVIFTVLYYNKLKNDDYNRVLANIQLILVAIILGTWNLFDSYRIVTLFLYTSILLLPRIVNLEKNKKIKLLLITIIVALHFVSGYTFLKNVSVRHPYMTIFEK